MNQNTILPTAFVSGSTAGIGKAIALTLAEAGFQVAINGRRTEGEVKELLDDLSAASGKSRQHLYCRGDISDGKIRKQISEIMAENFGKLTVLVNNAGVSTKNRSDMLELKEADMTELLKTNLIAPFMLTQELSSLLTANEQRSYLINISSISSYTASINRADYCISKAGISMMTKLYAQRLVEDNVRVFEIRPGIIKTDMTASVTDKYDQLIEDGLLPIKRWGKPEDVAKVVWGIVNGFYPYATGEVINIDGGFHMRSL